MNREPTVEGMNLKFKSTIWKIRKKKSIQSEQQEEKSIQKNENRIRSLWDISKGTDIQIIGLPEGVEEEQEIESLFEKIMKENLPNLVKEIDIQVQEAQRPTPRHIIIKMPKVKDKK